jgi:N-methylhydantoinase A/oxoprolinase/acetone carboxylase beta subunit
MDVSNILATDMGGTTFKVSVIRDGIVEKRLQTNHSSVIRFFLNPRLGVESIWRGGWPAPIDLD